MDTYLDTKRQLKKRMTGEDEAAITEMITRLDNEIRDDEQQLLEFQKNNSVVGIEEQSSAAANYLVGLTQELARTQKDYDYLSLVDKDPLANKLPDNAPAPSPGVGSVIDTAPGEAAQNAADNALTATTAQAAPPPRTRSSKIPRSSTSSRTRSTSSRSSAPSSASISRTPIPR
jgi:hypothetical protein